MQAKTGAIKLSPSLLTFQYDRCPHCFRAICLGWKAPYEGFPTVFGKIDREMRKTYGGCPARWLDASLVGDGVVSTREEKVVSREFTVPGHATKIYFSGKLDGLIYYGQTVGVLDFKTSQVKPEALDKYSRQLHAYALAIEQPASGEPRKVSHLGLMVSEPAQVIRGADYDDLRMQRSWVPVARNDPGFGAWLIEVVALIEAPPQFSDNCGGCALRKIQGFESRLAP